MYVLLEVLIFTLIFTVFAIRTSWFQTWLAHQASAYYSQEFGTEVYIDKVDIKFVDKVELKGVYIEDIQKDTFIYADFIHADIDDWSLSESFVKVSNVKFSDGHILIKKYKGDSTLNFQHIIDYFATDDVDTTSSNFEVDVANIFLHNIHFIYEDQNSEELANGMNFNRIELRRLTGGLSDFGMKGEEISISLDDLSFRDISGLELNKLACDVRVSPEIMELKKLQLGFNHSFLHADYIELKTPNGSEDFNDFVHNVRINSHFKNSKLYLSDLAYFVPNLWGLRGAIQLKNLETAGPVYGMNINNVDLSILDTTRIVGDFSIPDLSDISSSFFQEDLTLFQTSIDDVRKLHLEKILDEDQTIALEEVLAQYSPADVITLKNGSFIGGVESFVVDGDLYSGIGDVHLQYGLQFEWKEKEDIYFYSGPEAARGQILVENLNVGVIAGNDIIDKVSGQVDLSGKGFDEKSLDIHFTGNFKKVGINGYDYNDIRVAAGEFAKNKFTGEVSVGDDNLALVYNGSVDLKSPMHFDFVVKIDSAQVTTLTSGDRALYQRIGSKITVDITGTDVNTLHGSIMVEGFEYQDSSFNLKMDKMTLDIHRNPKADTITLRSPFADADITGLFHLDDVGEAIEDQLSHIIPNLIEDAGEHGEEHEEFFDLHIHLKEFNPILEYFGEEIRIAQNTDIRSEFNRLDKYFALAVNADYFEIAGVHFEDLKLDNNFDSLKAILSYQAQIITVNDSLSVRDFQFDSRIKDNRAVSLTGWDGLLKTEPALFAFETDVAKSQDILTTFRPSFFFLKGHKYSIVKNSSVLYNPEIIVLKDFKISHEEAYINANGILSKNPEDWLGLTVHNFDLSDLNGIIGETVELAGVLNVDGKLAGIFDQPKFEAKSTIDSLALNKYLVGDIILGSKWNELNKSISANGMLSRENKKTFSFAGDYFMEKKEDNLDFEARFENTDIAFLNAFDDPELYTNIEGILEGRIKIKGEPENPIVSGGMNIVSSSVTVPMFNVSFGAAGLLKLNDGEIIADHLRINDEEYNMADCQMQVYHYDWADFNYNILLDIDNPALSRRFLAMDTYYNEGDSYYGKAYVSGMVSISGYDGNTEIEVDITTENGTKLVMPMYGSSELEDASFIIFDEEFFRHDSLDHGNIADNITKVDRTGLTLIMKFNVTEDAEIKIVFDPVLEDQIISKGEGNLEIKLNDFGDMTMFGEYIIRDGRYEMRIKQLVEENFVLNNGSSVQWSGVPEDALINIQALFERIVTLQDIIPPEAPKRKKKEQVFGILSMTNTLMNPELSFDISAPKTDDFGQKAVNLIRADPDELNKQFFSLLVLKRFLPRYGGGAGGGDALLGLAETQINSILGGLSENYDLKAGLTETSTTIGVETKLNDRTTIKTSFGVLTDDQNGNGGGQIVGDVDIEYRLNDDGTFTMNFFNETNSSSITSQGNYTQGISLHYQETFNTTKQFRLWQKFLNMFRKKANRIKFEKKSSENGKWLPIPDDTDTTTTGLIFIR
jgi:TamB, inner membrane protein subunit of TAM complex